MFDQCALSLVWEKRSEWKVAKMRRKGELVRRKRPGCIITV